MSNDEIGEAVKLLQDTVRLNKGLATYVVVIEEKGKTESFKSVFKEIDGNHFYQHLIETVTDDVREDIDPTLTVIPLQSDVLRELFKGTEMEAQINRYTEVKARRTMTNGTISLQPESAKEIEDDP